MRKAKVINSELPLAKESATIARILADTHQWAEEWDKRKGWGSCSVGGCCHEAAVSTMTGS